MEIEVAEVLKVGAQPRFKSLDLRYDKNAGSLTLPY